jgi:hypothetical protein
VKRVKRISLNFEQEDQANFQRRLAYAEEAREQTKALLRYDHFITSQPAAQMRPMQPQTLQGIHDRVMLGMTQNTVSAMEAEEARRARWEEGDPPLTLTNLIRGLSSEAIKMYTWCMKKQVLMHRLQTENEELERYDSLRLPPLKAPPGPPTYGKLVIGEVEIPYEWAQEAIYTTHYTNCRETRSLVLWVHKQWELTLQHRKFMDVQLADIPDAATLADPHYKPPALSLPCQLGDFDALQAKHLADVTSLLRVEWRQAMAEHVTDHLQVLYRSK